MRFCHLLSVLLLPTLIAQAQQPGATSRPSGDGPVRPNILLIIADDLGLDKVSAYGLGDPRSRPATPTLDRLAAEGIRFTRAYSYPVCSATRATILTGQYGFRTGIRDVVRPRSRKPGLPLTDEVLPRRLTEAGYDHSHVGKWHLGTRFSGGPKHPVRAGWNWTGGLAGNPSRSETYWSYEKQVNGETSKVKDRYLTTDTTDDARARIAAMREPWHLWVAYNAPHPPLHIAPPALHKRDPKTAEQTRAREYRTMVEALDTEIGRLLDALDAETRARTLVIFVADNGTPREAVVKPFAARESKGSLNGGGCNVPLIMQGHGIADERRGSTSAALVSTVDLYATILDLAGAAQRGRVDGVSLVPHLKGEAVTREYVLAESGRMVMVTDGRYRLVREAAGGHSERTEFYDLSDAPEGSDGRNLCPPVADACPGALGPDQRQAFQRLEQALDRMLRSR